MNNDKSRIMLTKTQLDPICVQVSTTLLEVLRQSERAVKQGFPAGITLVVDEQGRLIGTITDGDIRRASLKYQSYEVSAEKVMNGDPIAFPDYYSFTQILEELPRVLTRKGRRSRSFLSKLVLIDDDRRPTRIIEYHQLWEQRVANHRHVVVLGLGYVGFTLALVLADRGFRTTGFDIDERRIAALDQGASYIHERGLDELFKRQLHKNFRPSSEFPSDGDVFIISVGTPVQKTATSNRPAPDLTALRLASEAVGRRLQRGNLVVLRSTVPVGTTREFVLPMMKKVSGLKGGLDFHLSFAPERTAEGKAIKELRELPQIIGGLNEESVEATAALFREMTSTIVRVNSLEQAEIAKLLNNSFRDLIFSFANHAAQIASHYNVDIVETIKAANQGYPRDPIPLPSPGVGGACLTKDPYIFSSVAKKLGMPETLFDFGREINESMLPYVVERVVAQLQKAGKEPGQCAVLICGLAFKGEPETGDIRNSTSVEIAHLLKERVGRLYGHDPIADREEVLATGIVPVAELSEGLQRADAVLFLNNHRFYEKVDLEQMIRQLRPPAIIFDGWKLFNTDDVLHSGPCVYMGLSFTVSSLFD